MDQFRNPKKIIFWVFCLLITGSLVLNACTTATESTETFSPTDVVDVIGEKGGTLRVAMQSLVNVDPALISTDSEVLVANHVYDYLIDIDSNNNLVPRLARTWNISEDGRTYTLTLEENVTFKDGTQFSANDVVWTFNRLRNPESGYPTADLFANIESISADSDTKVTFQLKESNPFFLYDLSDNHALVIKDGTTTADDFNGTGPFTVVDYRPEDSIILTANQDYWIDGQPLLDGLEIIFFNDDAAMVDALRSSQIDLVFRLPVPLFSSLQDVKGITGVTVPSNKFDAVRLRADRPPGSDPRVMQALKLATDKQAIFDLVLQNYGRIGSDNPIGPMYPQYHLASLVVPLPDIERAKQLLTDAGYPDGFQIDLHTPDTETRPDLAVALKEMWSKVGVEVNVIVEPENVYYGDNGWLEVDLGITGWGSRPYPQFYLDQMLTCDAIWNEAHWCDKQFDTLVNIAGTTMDEEARITAYNDIQRLLNERGPILIPYFSMTNAAIRDNFSGFLLKSFPGRTDLRTVYKTGE